MSLAYLFHINVQLLSRHMNLKISLDHFIIAICIPPPFPPIFDVFDRFSFILSIHTCLRGKYFSFISSFLLVRRFSLCLALSPSFWTMVPSQEQSCIRIPKNSPSQVNRSGGGNPFLIRVPSYSTPGCSIYVHCPGTDRTFSVSYFFSSILLPFIFFFGGRATYCTHVPTSMEKR